MAEERINNVVGDSFEELQVDEMTALQGAGDVNPETTPALVVASEAVIAGAATATASVAITKLIKE
ncbi:MAG: lichenicidin A2 family type 2 lantibiotic [Pseudobutyrivibrio sp.]|nr:lichenicidin A2 family type 2 lantibiotic [Pseudobutyrivibrio sp.]